MGDEVETLPPPGDPPEVIDASNLGGWIWVVLFGTVMVFSVITNGYLCLCVCQSKKKHNLVYFCLILIFLVNVADYGLLAFDFSLGLEHQYPHNQKACSVYQTVSKVNPVIQAMILVVMAIYAAKRYGKGYSSGLFGQKTAMGLTLAGLVLLYGLLALLPAHLASIVNVDGKRYCEIVTSGNHQRDISIFYLTYSAIFSFWLPLMLSIMPMIRLAKINRPDKYPEVSVVLATVSSFFIFYFMHGCVVIVRHSLDAFGMILDQHNLWMIKVAQSLLWLVAYFWHATRPILAFLMDSDLRSHGGCCCLPSNDLEDCGRAQSDPKNPGAPLQVLLTPTGEEAAVTNCEANLKDCDESHSKLLV